MAGNSPFSKFDHVGMVVKDLDTAVEHLKFLGIGPFKSLNRVVRQDTKLYGRPVDPDDVKLRVKLADIGGGVKIELIQPLGGGPWQDFVEAGGGGIHHLAFVVDDVEKEAARLAGKGVKVIYSARFQGGGAAAYLDISKLGGLVDVIEFVKWVPGMMPW